MRITHVVIADNKGKSEYKLTNDKNGCCFKHLMPTSVRVPLAQYLSSQLAPNEASSYNNGVDLEKELVKVIAKFMHGQAGSEIVDVFNPELIRDIRILDDSRKLASQILKVFE